MFRATSERNWEAGLSSGSCAGQLRHYNAGWCHFCKPFAMCCPGQVGRRGNAACAGLEQPHLEGGEES
eukprot:2054467-Amphidinium_carterae.1